MYSINLLDFAGGKIFCDFFGFVVPADAAIYTGAEIKLTVKSAYVGKAKVVAVRSFKVFQIRDIISALETGEADIKSFSRRLSMLHGVLKPDDDLIHVAVKYTEKDHEALSAMAQDWWKAQLVNQ